MNRSNFTARSNLKTLTNVGLLLLAILLSLAIGKALPLPFIWLGFLWFATFIYLMIAKAFHIHRAVWFNLGFAFLLFGVVESYLVFSSDNFYSSWRREGICVLPHEILGYAPTPDHDYTSQFTCKDQPIFDVRCTIDQDGLRISPPLEYSSDARSVLFFGGSFAYGAGVEDWQTLPYRVGQILGGKYRNYNFGFGGYGPHQMLAQLDSGIVDQTVKFPPKYAIYLAIPDHVRRSVGGAVWDQNGPMYVPSTDGTVKREGKFRDRRIYSFLLRQADKSALLKPMTYRFSKADCELYVQVVKESARLFERKFADSEFHVLFWNEGELSKELRAGVIAEGLRVHLVSEILPEFDVAIEKYFLSQYDPHPNPSAYERLANYTVSSIVR